MATIEVKSVSGKKVKSMDLNAAVFGIEPNVHAMHEVVRAQRASWRQGTHETLTRGNVRGGGKKPWRQKGTGHARQGTIRALSGLAAAPSSARILVRTPSRCRTRWSSWLCVPLCPTRQPKSSCS